MTDPIELAQAAILLRCWGTGATVEAWRGYAHSTDETEAASLLDDYDPCREYVAVLCDGEPHEVYGYEIVSQYGAGEPECSHVGWETPIPCPLCESDDPDSGFVYWGEETQVVIYAKRAPRELHFVETWDDGIEYSIESIADLHGIGVTVTAASVNDGTLDLSVTDAYEIGGRIQISPLSSGSAARIVKLLGGVKPESAPEPEPTDDIVVVERMPAHLRGSHKAAGNWGEYPHNGAERVLMTREDAEDACTGDDYDYILRSASETDLSLEWVKP